MGVLYEDVVVIRHAEKPGDSTVITVNCPDKTGLGCDLCRVILLFGLSISRGGKQGLFISLLGSSNPSVFVSLVFLVCGVWDLSFMAKKFMGHHEFFVFFSFFSGKFCSWDLIFLDKEVMGYFDFTIFRYVWG